MVYKYCFAERERSEGVQSVSVFFFGKSGLSEHLVFRSSTYIGPEYQSKVEQPCNDKMASVIALLGVLGWRLVGSRPAIYDDGLSWRGSGPLFEYAATTVAKLDEAIRQLTKELKVITEPHS